MNVKELVKRHEGFRRKPYTDTTGNITIGWGWNLSRRGLPDDICEELLSRELARVWRELSEMIPYWEELDEVRQAVLMDMAYNLGVKGLLYFRKMFNALEQRDYDKAADEMLNSRWASQVKTRAQELAQMMRTGKWLKDSQQRKEH